MGRRPSARRGSLAEGGARWRGARPADLAWASHPSIASERVRARWCARQRERERESEQQPSSSTLHTDTRSRGNCSRAIGECRASPYAPLLGALARSPFNRRDLCFTRRDSTRPQPTLSWKSCTADCVHKEWLLQSPVGAHLPRPPRSSNTSPPPPLRPASARAATRPLQRRGEPDSCSNKTSTRLESANANSQTPAFSGSNGTTRSRDHRPPPPSQTTRRRTGCPSSGPTFPPPPPSTRTSTATSTKSFSGPSTMILRVRTTKTTTSLPSWWCTSSRPTATTATPTRRRHRLVLRPKVYGSTKKANNSVSTPSPRSLGPIRRQQQQQQQQQQKATQRRDDRDDVRDKQGPL